MEVHVANVNYTKGKAADIDLLNQHVIVDF